MIRQLICFASIYLFMVSCVPDVSKKGTSINNNSNSTDANEPLVENCKNYQDDISKIISDNCLDCHSSGDTEPDLEASFNEALAPAIAGTILGEPDYMQMPMSGKLPSNITSVVESWKQSSFPESKSDCSSAGTQDPGINVPVEDMYSTGSHKAVTFAESLWKELELRSYVGTVRRLGYPIAQTLPEGVVENKHGMFVETLIAPMIEVSGKKSFAAIKFNYGPTNGENPTTAKIINDSSREKYLKAITIYFGEQSSQTGLFWAKYTPSGELSLDGTTKLAGEPAGCVGCHSAAKGGDYIFSNDTL